MKLAHRDAVELLELYALGALGASDEWAVAGHVAECAECRGELSALEDVVSAIPEALPQHAPRAELRARVLGSARAPRAPTGRAPLAWPGPRPTFAVAAVLAVALAASLALLALERREVEALRAERGRFEQIALALSQGGASWYMAGAERFDGSGGTLFLSRREGTAFVLFHDLKAIEPSARYAVWLISTDGSWVRGANFRPSGTGLERIDLGLQISGFVQCAVTVEAADSGKRAGPLVMQSRVFQPQTQ